MYPVLSSNLYGIVSKKIDTADIFFVSVCNRKEEFSEFSCVLVCLEAHHPIEVNQNLHFKHKDNKIHENQAINFAVVTRN